MDIKKKEDHFVFPIPQTTEEGHLILPMGMDDFTDFIKSLLGKPQSLNKKISGYFNLTIEHITNLHAVLTQRVNQQNGGQLIQFRGTIFYDDNTSILFENIDDLLVHNDLRDRASEAIVLEWDFMIQFQDKNAPEKQSVTVEFPPRTITATKMHIFEYRELRSQLANGLYFEIKHTAKTWGNDIEMLLTNHFEGIKQDMSNIERLIIDKRGWIGLLTSIIIMVITLFALSSINSQFQAKQVNLVDSALNNPNAVGFQGMEEKITALGLFLAERNWAQFEFNLLVYGLCFLAVSITVGIFVADIADNRRQSFLLLTKKSIVKKEKFKKRRKNKWIRFIFSVILSIAGSYVASLIFQYTNSVM